MRNPITLLDVARAAGVSTATVSRALAARRAGLPLRTPGAERALETADRLGYRINNVASALRTRSSRLLGVIVPDLTDTAVSQMYAGVEAKAAELGYQTCVANSRDDPALRAQRVDAFRTHGVDGIIFADAQLGESYFTSLAAESYPYLLMSRPLPGEIAVTCADEAGGRLAADHLLTRGHRHVAVLAGPPHAGNVVLRTRGFRDAASAADRCDVIESGFDVASTRAALDQYLDATSTPPTAIFATIDRFSLAAISVLAERGLSVGSDIAIVACNNSVLAANLPVPLTSVQHPLEGMGARSAEILTGMIENAPERTGFSSIAFEPELIIRASSDFSVGGPPPIG